MSGRVTYGEGYEDHHSEYGRIIRWTVIDAPPGRSCEAHWTPDKPCGRPADVIIYPEGYSPEAPMAVALCDSCREFDVTGKLPEDIQEDEELRALYDLYRLGITFGEDDDDEED